MKSVFHGGPVKTLRKESTRGLPDHPPQGNPTSQTPLHLGVGDTDTVSRWQGLFCEGKIRSLSLLLWRVRYALESINLTNSYGAKEAESNS